MSAAEDFKKEADTVLARIKNGNYTTAEEMRQMTQQWRALRNAAIEARKKEKTNE